MVLNPDRFDVIVASNLFGDILSDLGPATAGTIGIAASGNINPERTSPSIFEPVHGSAPDIAGKKIANPIAAIWSGALMLEHLGHAEAAADIVRAIERVIMEGPHTPDMKGKAGTGRSRRGRRRSGAQRVKESRLTMKTILAILGLAVAQAAAAAVVPRQEPQLLAGVPGRRRIRPVGAPPAGGAEEALPGDRDHHPVQARRRRRPDVDRR